MSYLLPQDYAVYGVEATEPEVQAASDLINAYLGRPHGLVWKPDAAGQPCYMAQGEPTDTFATTAPVSPGANVVVPVTPQGGFLGQHLVGGVLIFDRADATKTEACVITAVGAGTVTLAGVAYAHLSGAKLETGLVIFEERALPAKRAIVRFSKGPMVRLIAAQGRYGYGRRSDQISGITADATLLALTQPFGGPPAWAAIDVTHVDVSNTTQECWLPTGLYLAPYTDARLHYVTGWPEAAIPVAVRQACAMLIKSQADNDLPSGVKVYRAGGTMIEMFSEAAVPVEARAMLSPYKALRF